MQTIPDLVRAVQEAIAEEEIFLSPADVGRIVSLFLEGLIHHSPAPVNDALNEILQVIADECGSIRED